MALSRITVWSPGNVLTAQALNAEFDNVLAGVNVWPSSFVIGDLLYASSASALSSLADVATGNALISGGVGAAPSWGKIGLGTHVSGILPTANGGTGIAYFTAAGPTSARVYTFPDASDTVATLGVANTFTTTQTISNTAPSLVLTDTTASAKSLTIAVDANIADLRESAGASGSLLTLDLANNRVGIGTTGPTYQLQLSTDSAAKPSTNTWTIASDERMKDHAKQRPYTKGLADILALPDPHYFTYNGVADTPEGEESVGWNAQDLLPIAPKLVRTVKGKLTPKREQVTNPDGSVTVVPVPEDVRAATPEVDTHGINTHEVQYMVLNALKELNQRVSKLEAKH